MTPEERRLIEAFQNSSDNLNREEDESQNDTRADSDFSKRTLVKEFFRGLNPIEKHHWNDTGYIGKIFILLQSPFFIALKLIIPSVDDNDENLGWIKPIHTLNCVTLPVYGSYVSGIASKDLSFGIPVVLPVTIIASALSAYVYVTSEIEKPPPYFNVSKEML
ncbi:uncharacterized protein LOC124595129 [Schistocerca americana]|uniref:uncharacterized protein LOC124595129 n=1 Tax=Schistocerca americana TaxID=7009 RepID=UPI001F4FA660|nr:uncharacterized protein LOC124595129 [Schistocerca americana]